MSKKLKPLDALNYMLINCYEYNNLETHYKIIETELKRLEKIDKILNQTDVRDTDDLMRFINAYKGEVYR